MDAPHPRGDRRIHNPHFSFTGGWDFRLASPEALPPRSRCFCSSFQRRRRNFRFTLAFRQSLGFLCPSGIAPHAYFSIRFYRKAVSTPPRTSAHTAARLPFRSLQKRTATGFRCSEIYLADRVFRRLASLPGFRGFAAGGPAVPTSSLVLPVYRRMQDSSGVLPFASMSLSRKRLSEAGHAFSGAPGGSCLPARVPCEVRYPCSRAF